MKGQVFLTLGRMPRTANHPALEHEAFASIGGLVAVIHDTLLGVAAAEAGDVPEDVPLPAASKVPGLKAWKYAKSLAEKGKEYDQKVKYADALAYYETSLDYFRRAMSAPELTETMKREMRGR